ncbi:hypothetical protein [Allosalinactinospora lopnorensis]|uniref:hypothetical protein n=1 Tax=Allosalinactinospora lopnorensis TaxID=1352348 RepID=UPI001F2C64C2|nr:hypothetical protein [Allosalinactinospora lopnorensis]
MPETIASPRPTPASAPGPAPAALAPGAPARTDQGDSRLKTGADRSAHTRTCGRRLRPVRPPRLPGAARHPRLRGHRAEFATEHRRAAAIQAHHPHLVVWFGETTQSYWAATPTGLTQAPDTDTLLLAIWPHTARRP